MVCLGGRWLFGVVCGGLVVWVGWCNTLTSFFLGQKLCTGRREKNNIYMDREKILILGSFN